MNQFLAQKKRWIPDQARDDKLGNVYTKTKIKSGIKIKSLWTIHIIGWMILCTNICFGAASTEPQTFNQRFIQSFVKHYEFNPEGRYTHEYHPFLLEKTAESLDVLEQRVVQAGLNLAGRMVVFGYEENAVPCYYTNFRKPKINDEAILKNNIGWSPKLHNRFGIITGFLFKDFNDQHVFEHINPKSILVFDDQASIFQEDAFGEVLALMYKARGAIMRQYEKQNIFGVFGHVVSFWQLMFENNFKIGNKQMAGTQDILFSIEYLKHLLRSPLPFIKFFTGPDITYPIELSCKQEPGATRNAQEFAKTFVKNLQPIEDKSTVYIFCSFVDGVGKSTMLGNIKNWIKYGDAYENFEHVDNTSSQLFEVFKFKENVFIADLPAQISHFSYKPDGKVFVDARTVYQEPKVQKLASFVQENKDSLVQQYRNSLNTDNQAWFIKNLFLLDKAKENRWIPFTYQNEQHLFNLDQPWDMRVLCSLHKVKSEGLKNIAAEQMFFTEGVRFPLVYDEFLSKLTKNIKDEKIEQVVFVDFLSMYPRSSRENIRINYLMQQMALLKKGFDIKHSLYRDFVGGGGELLYSLLKHSLRPRFSESLETEALVRLALCNIINDARFSENLRGVGLKELTPLLDLAVQEIPAIDVKFAHDLVAKKLCVETAVLEQTYGLSKSFVNIQQFMPSAALAFSNIVQRFLTEHLEHAKMNELWGNYGELVLNDQVKNMEQGALNDVILKTQSGRSVRALYALDGNCKNEFLLTPVLRLMRAQWYMALSNLLYAQEAGHELYQLEIENFWVPPLLVKQGTDGLIYFVQPVFQVWDKEKKISPQVRKVFSQFNVDATHGKYGVYDERPYLLDWDINTTGRGVYAFYNDPEKAKKSSYTASAVSLLVHKYQKERGGLVMPAELLYERLNESFWWQDELAKLIRSALRNGEFRLQGAGILGGQRKTYRGSERNRAVAQMLIRLLVTLDMVVKDPDADIVVRYGNRQDFKAALMLFEKVTLPRYFGMLFPDGLFENYDEVEPYPSWDFWDSIDG